jgi:amidophosphoribosyltransferase
MATKWELIAANKSVEEIRQHIGADSLGYLSLEGLIRATRQSAETLCNACFTGIYPIDVQMQMDNLEPPSEHARELAALESLNRAGRP